MELRNRLSYAAEHWSIDARYHRELARDLGADAEAAARHIVLAEGYEYAAISAARGGKIALIPVLRKAPEFAAWLPLIAEAEGPATERRAARACGRASSSRPKRSSSARA